MEKLYIYGANTISGNTTNLPTGLTNLVIRGNNEITGNVNNLPVGLVETVIEGNNTINGDFADIPANSTYNSILGNNTLNTYTYPHSWPANMSFVQIVGSVSNTPTVIDNLFIDFTATTWTGSKVIYLKGTSGATATDAVNALISSGITVTLTP